MKIKRFYRGLLSIVLAVMLMASSLSTIGPALAEDSTVDSFYSAFRDEDPMPVLNEIDYQNVHGKGSKLIKITNESNLTVSSVSHQGGAGETADKLVDKNTGTKWCSTSTATLPRTFVFDAGAPISPKAYYISGAGDDMSYSTRVLHTWDLTASNSASGPWETVVDSRSGVTWQSNNQVQLFDVSSTPGAFRYYRLNVTKRGTGEGQGNGGTMQFSGFGLVNEYKVIGTDAETDYLFPQVVNGPEDIWGVGASKGTGWSGPNVLAISGMTTGADAKSYTVVYDNLNIKVHDNTKLSYMISPEGRSVSWSNNNYDYKLHSHHAAIDLVFSDGTRLKELGAKDQYGFSLSPVGQGKSKNLNTNQWNYVLSELGSVAAGKTITKILAGFEKPDSTPNHKVKTYFDDIKIYREDNPDLSKIELADLVDTREGTQGQGNFSRGHMMVQVGTANPFNYWAPSTNRSGSRRYDYVNSGMKHFAISHVASGWMGERGVFSFMADSVTEPTATSGAIANAVNNSNGLFSHENEVAHSYYYSVVFNQDDTKVPGVKMEITPTSHAAVLRFTFPAGSTQRNILFDSPDSTTDNYSKMVFDGKTFSAYTQHGGDTSGGSTGLKRMYVYGELSEVPANTVVAGSTARSMASFAASASGETVIELKVATSFMSAAQAKKNLELEIEGTENFDAVCAKAKAHWNKVLGAVKVEDTDANLTELTNFYTKLYRANLYPTMMEENTGTNEEPIWQYTSPYRGTNATPVIMDGHFSYNEGWWDTYRTKWSLLAFLRPKASAPLFDGVVQHFLDNDGRGSFAIPRWVYPAGGNMMVGTSSDVILADGYLRGVDFNYKAGYLSAVKSASVYSTDSANGGRNGLQTSIFKGYTPYGAAPPAGGGGQLDTSWALEGFLNDGGMSKMALKMRDEIEDKTSTEWRNLNDEYLYFLNRSKYFVNQFNPAKGGWMRNKNMDGTWTETDEVFNPFSWGNGFCEDNAFPYSVLAPQDGQGLANLYGGREAFGAKMDDIFTNNGDYVSGGYGGWIHEAGEKREAKLGQVAMSNQTAFHLPYMFLYAGQPWKTQQYTREIIGRLYNGGTIGQGYPGDEDNGSSAAWYVWSALGLYPLDMGSGESVITSPLFKKTIITTDDGKTFTINAPNNSHDNVYIESMTLNGQPYNKTYLKNSDFVDGMTIDFVMSPTPTKWATAEDSLPPSVTQGDGPENTPDVLMDVTNGVKAVTALPTPEQETNAAYVTDITTANAANLFDDSSTTTDANFTAATASIHNYIATGAKVEMYTLTSSNTADRDPKAWTFSGSNDGVSWTELDKRIGETFRWRRYTRPFAIDPLKQGKYKYYRLSVTETSSAGNLMLAQYELLSDQYSFFGKADLLAKMDEARALDHTKYGADEYALLQAALDKAQALYDDANATGKQISQSIDEIQTVISSLILIRKANEPFNAVGFNTASSGIKAESSTPTAGSDIPLTKIPNIGGSFPGAILGYRYMDFGSGDIKYARAKATYAGNTADCNGAHIKVHLDAPDGPVIADIDTPPTFDGTSWSVYKYGFGDIEQPDLSGIHSVYFELLNGGGNHVANIYQFVFEEIIPVESVALNQATATLNHNKDDNKTAQLTATVSPANATNKNVTWASSDDAIAIVSADGLVTAVANGTATITATAVADSTKAAACTVTVETYVAPTVPVESVALNQATATLSHNKDDNKTVQLTASVIPTNATDKTVTWTSSDEAVATVNTDGLVTAVAIGTATITAAAGSKTATCIVTVETYVAPTVPVESVALNQATATLNQNKDDNKTVQLTASVIPTNATDKTVTWTSSDEAVATVNTDGLVTAVAIGTATITATAGSKTATCIVTVETYVAPTVPVESVALNQATATLDTNKTEAEKSIQLTATVNPDNATDKTVTWISDTPAVATVDQTGKVTAIAKGTATITATAGGKTATCTVTVETYVAPTVPVESVTLNQATATLDTNKTEAEKSIRLTAAVNPDNATDKTVTWISDTPAVATVDQTGKVTAIGKGTATITATAGGKTATCTVTVETYVAPTVPVESVTLDKASATLDTNKTETEKSIQLTATVNPDNATDKTVTWISDTPAVATVDQTGKVTAIAKGTANITATAGSKTATCTVTVVTHVEEENVYTPPTTRIEIKQNKDGSTTKTVTDLKTGGRTSTTTYPDGTKIVYTVPKDSTPTIEVTVPKDKGSVTVTIPIAEKPGPGTVAVIVKPNGTKGIIKNSVATEDGIRVTLTEGSKLEIIDNSKRFIDVETKDWFDGGVQFVSSRELFNGTTPDTFSPDAPMSRAMLMTVLARLDGQDTNMGETWYSAGMEWAVKNDISDGTGPEQGITREQLAVMLYRYAKATKTEADLSKFADADKVNGWASEAMHWAVANDILIGKPNGILDPQGTASRAEVAAMIQRFVEKLKK